MDIMVLTLIFSGFSALAALICAFMVVRNTSQERIRLIVDEAIERAILRAKLDSEHSYAAMAEFHKLEDRVDALYGYAHSWKHKFSQWFTVLFLKTDIKSNDLPPEIRNGQI